MDVKFIFGWAKDNGIDLPTNSDGNVNIPASFELYNEWKKKGNGAKVDTSSNSVDTSEREGYNINAKGQNFNGLSYNPTEYIKAVKKHLAEETDDSLKERYRDYIKDVENEPQISKDLQGIANAIGSELLGFEYRLKSAIKDRFYQKIAEDSKKRNKDNVRYTMKIGDDIKEVNAAFKELTANGYEPLIVKNYWKTDSYYKGINTNWKSPNGTIFEIQFHSPHNLEVKEALHPLYEKWRTLNPDSAEAKKLEEQQSKISQRFIKPKDIEKL